MGTQPRSLWRPNGSQGEQFLMGFPLTSATPHVSFSTVNRTGVGVLFWEEPSFVLPWKSGNRSCSHRSFLPMSITASTAPWKTPVTVGAGGPASSPSRQGTPPGGEALVTLIKVCELCLSCSFFSLVKGVVRLQGGV